MVLIKVIIISIDKPLTKGIDNYVDLVNITYVCPLSLVVCDSTAPILHLRRRNGTKMGLCIVFQLITSLIYIVLPVRTSLYKK